MVVRAFVLKLLLKAAIGQNMNCSTRVKLHSLTSFLRYVGEPNGTVAS